MGEVAFLFLKEFVVLGQEKSWTPPLLHLVTDCPKRYVSVPAAD